jgi:2-haloacid dehalogenase
MAALWRVKQLEYTWTLTLMGDYEDFRVLTERALDFVLERFSMMDNGLKHDLLEAYRTLDAYPDVKPVLTALHAAGVRCAVFTNGTAAMAEAAIGAAGVEKLLEQVISVDAIRQFKTAPAAYRLVSRSMGLPLADITLVSSNRWDVAGAIIAGMPAIWCNRAGAPDEYPAQPPRRIIAGLHGLLEPA